MSSDDSSSSFSLLLLLLGGCLLCLCLPPPPPPPPPLSSPIYYPTPLSVTHQTMHWLSWGGEENLSLPAVLPAAWMRTRVDGGPKRRWGTVSLCPHVCLSVHLSNCVPTFCLPVSLCPCHLSLSLSFVDTPVPLVSLCACVVFLSVQLSVSLCAGPVHLPVLYFTVSQFFSFQLCVVATLGEKKIPGSRFWTWTMDSSPGVSRTAPGCTGLGQTVTTVPYQKLFTLLDRTRPYRTLWNGTGLHRLWQTLLDCFSPYWTPVDSEGCTLWYTVVHSTVECELDCTWQLSWEKIPTNPEPAGMERCHVSS